MLECAGMCWDMLGCDVMHYLHIIVCVCVCLCVIVRDCVIVCDRLCVCNQGPANRHLAFDFKANS